jgi:hypothetical protein
VVAADLSQATPVLVALARSLSTRSEVNMTRFIIYSIILVIMSLWLRPSFAQGFPTFAQEKLEGDMRPGDERKVLKDADGNIVSFIVVTPGKAWTPPEGMTVEDVPPGVPEAKLDAEGKQVGYQFDNSGPKPGFRRKVNANGEPVGPVIRIEPGEAWKPEPGDIRGPNGNASVVTDEAGNEIKGMSPGQRKRDEIMSRIRQNP